MTSICTYRVRAKVATERKARLLYAGNQVEWGRPIQCNYHPCKEKKAGLNFKYLIFSFSYRLPSSINQHPYHNTYHHPTSLKICINCDHQSNTALFITHLLNHIFRI